MRQQVNFYQEELFAKQKKPFCLQHLLLLWGAGVVMVMLMFANGYMGIRKQEADQAAVERELVAVKQQYKAVESQFPHRKEIAQLKKNLIALEQELGFKKKLAETLSTKTSSNLEGFSKYLEGLARQSWEATWLSNINYSEGGSKITLRGDTYKADSVVVLAQSLKSEEAYAAVELNAFLINRLEDEAGQKSTGTKALKFALSTDAKDQALMMDFE